MPVTREIYAYFRNRGFLLLVGISIVALALFVNEAWNTSDSSAPVSQYEIHPAIEELAVGESIEFELVDKKSGVAVPAAFEIVTPHNVPGDRGVFIENVYTAPRWIPHEHIVTFTARARGEDDVTEHVIEVYKDGMARVDETASPGGSHRSILFRPKFDPPIGNGMKLGSSTKLTVDDAFGGDVLVAYYLIEHENEVVDYAGSITNDGIYTAPSVMPDPPNVTIYTAYYREGGESGSLSGVGARIEFIP